MFHEIEIEMCSGNIIADLDLPDAEMHFLKAQIMSEAYHLTHERKPAQMRADELF